MFKGMSWFEIVAVLILVLLLVTHAAGAAGLGVVGGQEAQGLIGTLSGSGSTGGQHGTVAVPGAGNVSF